MSWNDFLTPDDRWGLRAWVTLALLALLPVSLAAALFILR
jgi:hypothetical protein